MSMFERFVIALKYNCSVREGDAVVVCCSGGLDSMVLLHLMRKAASTLGLRLGVVHVDHGIRNAASKKDALFVAGVCRSLQLPLHVYELHMDQNNSNLEEYAREKRYDSIIRCMREYGYNHAATGHTMDDQAETLIYRIIRGSGMRGLSGMDYSNPIGLIRPMLGFTRGEISRYADANDIGFVYDGTNEDTTLVRNYIRHKLVPLMKEINPGVTGALSRLSEIARQEGNALENMACALKEKAELFDWNLIRAYRRSDLIAASEAVVKRMIISILCDMIGEPRGVDAIQVQGVYDVLKGKKRAHAVKRRIRTVLDNQAMIFMDAGGGPFFDFVIEREGIFRIEGLSLAIKVGFPEGYRMPVRIRSYAKGDRINGKRVVKIMSDKGIMRSLRGFWPILLCNDEIISIPGIIDSEGEPAVHTKFPCYE